MSEETQEKKDINFSVYKNYAGKYFVKYAESAEREITKYEYDKLIQEKERIFETKMVETAQFAQSDKIVVTDTYTNDLLSCGGKMKLEFFKHPTAMNCTSFRCGSCYGECYLTQDAFVVECIYNSQKGNGDFVYVTRFILNYCLKIKKKAVFTNLSERLVEWFKRDFIWRGCIQATKNTIVII